MIHRYAIPFLGLIVLALAALTGPHDSTAAVTVGDLFDNGQSQACTLDTIGCRGAFEQSEKLVRKVCRNTHSVIFHTECMKTVLHSIGDLYPAQFRASVLQGIVDNLD